MAIETLDEYLKRKKKTTKTSNVKKPKSESIESIDAYAKRMGTNLPSTKVNKKKGIEILKKSEALDDGINFGNIIKTAGATLGDIGANIGKGFERTAESIADTIQYRLSDNIKKVAKSDLTPISRTLGFNPLRDIGLNALGKKIGENIDPKTKKKVSNKLNKVAKGIKENADFNSTGALFGENSDEEGNLFKKGWHKELDKNSISGGMLDSVGEGMGNIAAMAGMSYMTGGSAISSAMTSFTSGYGSARQEASRQGIGDKQANTYGIINGMSEAISEQFFDGIPGLKTAGWGNKVVGKVGGGVKKYFGTKAGKVATRIILNSGEGFEEVVSNSLNAIGNDIAYKLDKDYTINKENQTGNIVKDALSSAFSQESLEAFISSSLTSSILNTGSKYITNKQKNDLIKAYAEDKNISVEKAKQLFKDTVDTSVKLNDKGLDMLEREELENNTERAAMEQIKKGTFVTKEDKINNLVDKQIEEMRKENNLPISESELNKKREEIKARITDEIDNVDKYTEYTYEKTGDLRTDSIHDSFIKAGANNTKETRDKANMFIKLAKDMNVDIEVVNNKQLYNDNEDVKQAVNDVMYEATKDGKELTQEEANSIIEETVSKFGGFNTGNKIVVNLDSPDGVNFVIGHEIGHTFKSKSNDLFNQLANEFKDYYTTKETYMDDYKKVAKTYEKIGNVNVEEELTCNYLGRIAEDKEFLNHLSTKNPSMLTRIYEAVKELYYKATGQTEKLQYARIKKSIEKVYRESAKNNITEKEDTKYSISDNGKLIDNKTGKEEVLNVTDNQGRELTKEQQDYFKDSKVRDEEGDLLTVYHSTPEQFTVFDKTKLGENTGYDNTGFGTFVTTNKKFSERFKDINNEGKNGETMELYADAKKPIVHPYKSGIKYGEAEASKLVENYFKAIGEKEALTVMQDMISDGDADNLYEAYMNIVLTDSSEIFENVEYEREQLEKNGYDAIEIIEGTENELVEGSKSNEIVTSYAIFNSNQIKNVDNLKPTNNPDIRKSLSGNQEVGQTFSNNLDTMKLSDMKKQNLPYTDNKKIEKNNLPTKQESIKEDKPMVDKEKTKDIKEVQNVIGTQSEYLSNKASSLYDEIKGLKKGVKASDELGSILDMGYSWKDIKTALSNIKWKPDTIVNENSNVESVIREMITRNYESKLKDLSYSQADVENKNILSSEDKVKLKRRNYIQQVSELQENLNTVTKNIDNSILSKQAEYESKQNKDTIVAQKLLRQISDLKIRKSNIEIDYNNRINKIKEKIDNFDVKEESRKVSRQKYKESQTNKIADLIKDSDKWKDKKLLGGLRYARETAQRNMLDVAGEDGKIINETIFDPIQVHEADKNRNIKENFETIRKLDLNLKEKYKYNGEKIGEDELVRLYIENEITDKDLNLMNANVDKIKQASTVISDMLENTFNRANEKFKSMGLPEIEHRKNYFPHGVDNKADTLLSRIASKVGIDITNQDLPTEIAGRTDTFKPNKAWNGHLLQRKGNKTSKDAIGNLEKYIVGMEDIIAHTEDIQNVRALSQGIRNQFSDEETQSKVEKIRESEVLSEEEKDSLIDDVYKRSDSQLSGLVTWLDEYANVLANKKSFADRDIEHKLNRNVYRTMNNVDSIIAANTIGGNFSVSLTNLAVLSQAMATTNPVSMVKSAFKVLENDAAGLLGKKSTSFIDESDFLTNRFEADRIGRKKLVDKIKNIAFTPMQIVDEFASEVIVRAKYDENIRKGMSHEEAMHKADIDSAKIMADRSKGALPTMFNEKNPFSKLITMFQVEPNNIISNYTKDMSRDSKNVGQLAYQYTKLAIGSYIFNGIMMSIRGGNEVLPDPIRFVQYMLKAMDDDSDDEERKKAGSDMLEAITGAVPFLSNVAGLFGFKDVGRVPISSGIPDLTQIPTLFDDSVSKEYKEQTFRDEVVKPLSYFILPTGAAQVWKTIQGLDSVSKGESVKYGKDGTEKIQFPIDNPTIKDYLKAGIFGKYSLDNAKEYMDRGFKSMTRKDMNEYKDFNLPYKDYLNYKDNLKKEKKAAKELGENQTEAVYDYIYNLPYDMETKNKMINSSVGNNKDKNGYEKYRDSKGKNYWYDETTGKVYDTKYNELDKNIDDLKKVEVDLSDYDNYGSYEEFIYANKNPDKYKVITQITDYNSYNEYKDEIKEIADYYSELSSNANNSKQKTAISKSKKAEIRKYIEGLPLNKYQKVMLEKEAGGYSIGSYKNMLRPYINDLELTKEEKKMLDYELFGGK